MFWDFYLSPIGECVVRCGCSRLEERGSIYLVDPAVTIEVRGEEVLTSTLCRSRRWRQVPWMTRWFRAVLRDLGFGIIAGDTLIFLCCCCSGNQSRLLAYFLFPLDVRPLKTTYSWWRGPMPLLGDRLWLCRVRVRVWLQRRWMVRLRDTSLRSSFPMAGRIKMETLLRR
jgi:hypothetical protein